MSSKTQEPQIRKISPLSENEAKWTELRKIEWTDQVLPPSLRPFFFAVNANVQHRRVEREFGKLPHVKRVAKPASMQSL